MSSSKLQQSGQTSNLFSTAPICEQTFTHATGSDVPESFLSSQSHEPFESVESESSQILSSQSRVINWSSRVIRMVESLRVIGLQARVNIESYKITNFSYIFLAIGPPVDLQ